MFLNGINLILIIFYSGHATVTGNVSRKPFICNVTVDQQTTQLENSSYLELSPRSFLTTVKQYWPNGIIPYEIDPLFSESQVQFIKNATKQFEDNSCVRWVPHENQQDYVYFAKHSRAGVCNSYVGRRGLKQLINLNDECFEIDDGYQGAILHEMMHTIGFIHEQQRLDRNCYVKVTESAVRNFSGDFAIVLNTSTDFPYDFGSIMHYGISQQMHIQSNQNKSQHLGNIKGEFTKMDILKINFMYCGGSTYCKLYPNKCAEFENARKRCVISNSENDIV